MTHQLVERYNSALKLINDFPIQTDKNTDEPKNQKQGSENDKLDALD